MNALLEVRNLSVRLNQADVIRDVSFSVEAGKTVAVIGPNGSGKTTLFRALLGILPYEGEIIWHRRARFGYVPQQLEFDRAFPLTVRELFLLKRPRAGFWLPSESVSALIQNALNHVGAEHLVNRRVGHLSGGELQRVLIATALFEKPDVLFFDEPTAGIDIGGEVTVYKLIEHLAEELKLTVFLISHDLAVVSRYVDQVLCINQRLLCSGAPEKVLTAEQLRALYGSEAAVYRHEHEEEEGRRGHHGQPL
ncbi:hypothetical protein A3F28_00265 [Candidatus Uhrbacteria bacterium RIFCSPHIGHO2_12_FULL_57_11]|uniref:ABC transporter domain-containing protein n=2 Tax=Candidatus Uhriibacteriota TaxID=1752732 RepID=A0A1F7UQ77_9BACT|nr:MAG: hypothetical protein A3D72_02740 [Candidatus Uhrbacteria bacterium RIFCSPHIGHO2_02_FULL_57_19]OGL79858.1 MAG: hypothetical protein A3F28_00265 [Candidatus Uhrbacteria bacterium RIFCSPHIGHO2_12_FULL_57_11]